MQIEYRGIDLFDHLARAKDSRDHGIEYYQLEEDGALFFEEEERERANHQGKGEPADQNEFRVPARRSRRKELVTHLSLVSVDEDAHVIQIGKVKEESNFDRKEININVREKGQDAGKDGNDPERIVQTNVNVELGIVIKATFFFHGKPPYLRNIKLYQEPGFCQGAKSADLLVFVKFWCYNIYRNMAISKEHIEHLAALARLDITEKEKETYAEQISAVLDYFEQLKELDTKNVEPLCHVFDLLNITREDKTRLIFSADRVLAEAPELEKNQIKVAPALAK